MRWDMPPLDPLDLSAQCGHALYISPTRSTLLFETALCLILESVPSNHGLITDADSDHV